MSVLWLRFLSEIKDSQEKIPEDFTQNKEITQALELLKESSYTIAELESSYTIGIPSAPKKP